MPMLTLLFVIVLTASLVAAVQGWWMRRSHRAALAHARRRHELARRESDAMLMQCREQIRLLQATLGELRRRGGATAVVPRSLDMAKPSSRSAYDADRGVMRMRFDDGAASRAFADTVIDQSAS